MTTQAWLIMDATQKAAAMAFNTPSIQVQPREILNPLANNLGEGVLIGKFVAPARLLNDPDYAPFYAYCSTLPIRTIDSEVLFLPDPID